jgi:C4-dicarboxylate transporter DctM subunit
MPQDLVIWIVALWFVFFLILGQHVATVLFASGLLGIALWVGPQVFAGIIGTNVFFTASSYSLSIIPLYLLMAQMLLRGGVIVDLFHVGYRLAGQRRFPLGLATVVSGGLLGAVSGSGAATSAALATLAAPQLSQIGYTRRMSVAIAAVAGSLSAIIPPSLIMIIYGSLTAVSIGHLFIGALLPASASASTSGAWRCSERSSPAWSTGGRAMRSPTAVTLAGGACPRSCSSSS